MPTENANPFDRGEPYEIFFSQINTGPTSVPQLEQTKKHYHTVK